MSVREYVGARYVPIIDGPWDNTKTYEPLIVVTYQGNSYISRQYVPAGIDIENEQYWVISANYNAQIDAYRQETEAVKKSLDEIAPLDAEPTEGSTKGVTSGGVYAADKETKDIVDEIAPLDAEPTEGSTKGVTSGGVYDAIENAINTTNDFPHGFLCISRNKIDEARKVNFFYTSNFENITLIDTKTTDEDFDFNDYCYIKKIGDFYYIFSNTVYSVTKDFKNYAQHLCGWSDNVFGYCPVDNSNYFIANHSSSLSGPFTVGLYSYVQNESNGFLTFTYLHDLAISNLPTSVIDIDILYLDNHYYIAEKDENASNIVLFYASGLDTLISGNWSKQGFDSDIAGVEGPKLFASGEKINLLVSAYEYRTNIIDSLTGDTDIASDNWIGNRPILFKNVFDELEPYATFCKMNTENRHLGIIPVDATIAKAFNCVETPQELDVSMLTIRIDSEQSGKQVTYEGPFFPNVTWHVFHNGCLKTNFTKNKQFTANYINENFSKNYVAVYTKDSGAGIYLNGYYESDGNYIESPATATTITQGNVGILNFLNGYTYFTK